MVPGAQPAILVKKRDVSPLAIAADQFGALDRRSGFKGAVQVRIAESAKQCFQLIEETRRVFAFAGAVGLPLALSARVVRHEENQGKEHAKRNRVAFTHALLHHTQRLLPTETFSWRLLPDITSSEWSTREEPSRNGLYPWRQR